MAEKKKEKKEKPLDKWTVKELREEALKLPDVVGAHGMNKEELLEIIREARGIPAPQRKKSGTVRELKKKIVALKKVRDEERSAGAESARLDTLRRKISRLKKQTRR